jgi:hypothetical protein
MQETPRQLLAPALPSIMVELIRANCSDTDFLTIAKLRDLVLADTIAKIGQQPADYDVNRLKARVRYSLQTAQDIDPRINVKYHQTTRKTPIIKIYYRKCSKD